MHFQNLPINRCNPSPETTISQVTTYHCFCSPHQKIYSFVYFPLQLCFPVQQNHISVQKIERAAKSATLPYAFYIFEVLIFSFVVWFPVHDPIRPVDLLQQYHAHQLMRKRHFRKANLLLR